MENTTLKPNPTQCDKILAVLLNAKGDWVNGGEVFLHKMWISQFHTRIWELQRQGHNIEVLDLVN